jgi:hypothetical protein
LVGDPDVDVRYELLSRETAREALSTYDLAQPFANSLAVETVSLGAAVSLLNDLDWYLVRYVRTAWVLEPSVDDTEYLSRDLATAVRNDRVDPETTGERLAIYGVVDDRPVDPLYARRTDGSVPEYDLREVDDTVVVRVGENEGSS